MPPIFKERSRTYKNKILCFSIYSRSSYSRAGDGNVYSAAGGKLPDRLVRPTAEGRANFPQLYQGTVQLCLQRCTEISTDVLLDRVICSWGATIVYSVRVNCWIIRNAQPSAIIR